MNKHRFIFFISSIAMLHQFNSQQKPIIGIAGIISFINIIIIIPIH